MHAFKTARRPTQHYKARAARRALRPDVEDFLMTWGTATRAAGATHITLVLRNLPVELQESEQAARARGWIIVSSDDGSLITCYRRMDAWNFIRRKSQMRRRARRISSFSARYDF